MENDHTRAAPTSTTTNMVDVFIVQLVTSRANGVDEGAFTTPHATEEASHKIGNCMIHKRAKTPHKRNTVETACDVGAGIIINNVELAAE